MHVPPTQEEPDPFAQVVPQTASGVPLCGGRISRKIIWLRDADISTYQLAMSVSVLTHVAVRGLSVYPELHEPGRHRPLWQCDPEPFSHLVVHVRQQEPQLFTSSGREPRPIWMQPRSQVLMQTARPAARLSRLEVVSAPIFDAKDESPNAGEAAKSTTSPAKTARDLIPARRRRRSFPRTDGSIHDLQRCSARRAIGMLRTGHSPSSCWQVRLDVRRQKSSRLSRLRQQRDLSRSQPVAQECECTRCTISTAQSRYSRSKQRIASSSCAGYACSSAAWTTKQGWSVDLIAILHARQQPIDELLCTAGCASSNERDGGGKSRVGKAA